eukprot:868412-Amphidinium_carterae.2
MVGRWGLSESHSSRSCKTRRCFPPCGCGQKGGGAVRQAPVAAHRRETHKLSTRVTALFVHFVFSGDGKHGDKQLSRGVSSYDV